MLPRHPVRLSALLITPRGNPIFRQLGSVAVARLNEQLSWPVLCTYACVLVASNKHHMKSNAASCADELVNAGV